MQIKILFLMGQYIIDVVLEVASLSSFANSAPQWKYSASLSKIMEAGSQFKSWL
jgi:hypothetical protein